MAIVKKLSLQSTIKAPLQLFFFSVEEPIAFSRYREKKFFVDSALSYDIEDAFESLKNKHVGKNFEKEDSKVVFRGSVPIKELLNHIDFTAEKIIKYEIVEEKKNKKDKINSYICSLKYAKDNFSKILSKNENLVLEKIINKIEKNNK